MSTVQLINNTNTELLDPSCRVPLKQVQNHHHLLSSLHGNACSTWGNPKPQSEPHHSIDYVHSFVIVKRRIGLSKSFQTNHHLTLFTNTSFTPYISFNMNQIKPLNQLTHLILSKMITQNPPSNCWHLFDLGNSLEP